MGFEDFTKQGVCNLGQGDGERGVLVEILWAQPSRV